MKRSIKKIFVGAMSLITMVEMTTVSIAAQEEVENEQLEKTAEEIIDIEEEESAEQEWEEIEEENQSYAPTFEEIKNDAIALGDSTYTIEEGMAFYTIVKEKGMYSFEANSDKAIQVVMYDDKGNVVQGSEESTSIQMEVSLKKGKRYYWVVYAPSKVVHANFSITQLSSDTKGKLGTNVEWEVNDSGVLILSGKGATINLTEEAPWQEFSSDITSVEVKEGITQIGKNVLSNLSILSVSLPESLEIIEDGAFTGNSALSSITIPKSVYYIGQNAFGNCSSLKTISYKGDAPSIESASFSGCNALTVYYPKGNKTWKQGVFLKYGAKSAQYLAKEYPVSYDISYDLDGGVNNSLNPEQGSNLQTITLKNPTKQGYTFLGWYNENNRKVTTIVRGTTQDQKLIAKWQVNSYTITYYLNGGINSSDNVKRYTVNDDVILEEPTKKGYEFQGWYSDVKCTKEVTSFDKGSTGNKVVYAKWQILTYEIEYHLNGGTNYSKNPSSYTVLSNLYLYTPAKTGYSFAGWYSDAECTKRVTSIAKGNTGDKELYAKWNIITYRISYVLYGGKNDSDNPTYYTVEDALELKEPTRAGYTFVGWSTNPKGTNIVAEIEPGTTGIKTYYAIWQAIKYSIYYDLDGGSDPGNKTSYTILDTISLRYPTKKGYTFMGWYSDAQYTKRVTSIARGNIGDKELFAKWSLNSYRISYVLNGGKNNSDNPATYTVEDAVELKEPTKAGYTFVGWSTDYRGNNIVSAIEPGTITAKTYYAIWTANKYSISYDLDGGSDPGNKTSYTTLEVVTLKNPQKAGCTFAGWYSDAEYTKRVTSIPKGSSGDIQLYAKWNVNNYSITYYLNGGTSIEENPKIYTANDSFTLKNPIRKGYTFAGWYTSSNYTEKVTSVSNRTGNLNLYAKWVANSYQIEYELNGGTNNEANPNSYSTGQTISLKNPTKAGCSFLGWYSDDQYLNKVTSISSSTTGNLKLYAAWVLVPYSVSYELDGGTNNVDNPSGYTFIDSFELKEPTKKGYTFMGWYKDPSYTNSTTSIEKGTQGNITLFAKWKMDTSSFSKGEYVVSQSTMYIYSGASTNSMSIAKVDVGTKLKVVKIVNGDDNLSSVWGKLDSPIEGYVLIQNKETSMMVPAAQWTEDADSLIIDKNSCLVRVKIEWEGIPKTRLNEIKELPITITTGDKTFIAKFTPANNWNIVFSVVKGDSFYFDLDFTKYPFIKNYSTDFNQEDCVFTYYVY